MKKRRKTTKMKAAKMKATKKTTTAPAPRRARRPAPQRRAGRSARHPVTVETAGSSPAAGTVLLTDEAIMQALDAVIADPATVLPEMLARWERVAVYLGTCLDRIRAELASRAAATSPVEGGA